MRAAQVEARFGPSSLCIISKKEKRGGPLVRRSLHVPPLSFSLCKKEKRGGPLLRRSLHVPPFRCLCNCNFRCLSSSRDAPHPSPFQILGLSQDCTQEDIKAAFRIKVKEYHPDVYRGQEDAVAITQKLIEAYEVLLKRVGQSTSVRRSMDPFDNPECEAQDVFVYELDCIGRGCPYACVDRAPAVFRFAAETGCARAVAQGQPDDYEVQLAVGQCPRNCIYYVTPLQRETLERVLERALEGTFYSTEMALLESLLARAKFENGRYTASKREAKTSTEWVDWY